MGVFLKSFSAIFSLVLALAILSPATPAPAELNYYYQGNRYYDKGDYTAALAYYRSAIAQNPALIERFPKVQLKLANAFFHAGLFGEAIAALEHPAIEKLNMRDYADLLTARAYMQYKAYNEVEKILTGFRLRFPESVLQVPVDSLLADLYFRQESWSAAARLYRKQLRYAKIDKAEVRGRLMYIAKQLGHRVTLEKQAFFLIRKYPYHPQSRIAYQEIQSRYDGKRMRAKQIQYVFNYLSETEQFELLKAFLDQQVAHHGLTEMLRWLKINQLYESRDYWASLQASQAQRKRFRKGKYLRNIDLNIARSYLRMGLKDEAITAYDTFQKRYPRDGIAAEVLWVIAWLSEEQGRPAEARQYYQRLIRRYRRYELTPEAQFRIGLSHYSEGDYDAAKTQWQAALLRKTNDAWRHRLTYWMAKAEAVQGNASAYEAQLKSITEQPFDSYYSMKALLLTSNSVQIRHFLDSLLTEMQQKPISYLPKYLDHFHRPLLVQEIFGEGNAQRELGKLARRLQQPGWELTFALGEMNERLQNYGRAYRYYRRVYLENFTDSNWREWLFLVKNLYPLYFNGEVNQYARKWNITPASIWAVMKKESAFEPQITSYANAYGLMQIIPPTADRLSESLGMERMDVRRLFEPDLNIHLGSYYLSELFKRYDGNMYYALAAYNAGEHRVDRWRKVYDTDDDDFFMENIEYEQTRKYVRGVMKYYWLYHLLIHPYQQSDNLADFAVRVARAPWFLEIVPLHN